MASLSLDWTGDLTFKNSPGSPAIELHSSTPGTASPTQALAYGLMACMGMDVVHVLQKGRHALSAMTVSCEAERAAGQPRRYLSMTVNFDLTGSVPDAVVARAIALSRTKYCSVWHSLRQDIELRTRFTVSPDDASSSSPP